MAKADMDKRKTSGPFMPKWLKVKNAYKALKTGKLFKPDISPLIDAYDKTLTDYDALSEEKAELNKVVVELVKDNSANAEELRAKVKELDDLTKKSMDSIKGDNDQLRSYASGKDTDSKEIVKDLTEIVDNVEDYIGKRKSLWSEIESISTKKKDRMKKGRDDYKAKSDALESKIDKLTDTAASAQSDIEKTLATYSEIAGDADHDDIVKGLQSLSKAFPK